MVRDVLRRAPLVLSLWFFCKTNRENDDWCCECLDDLRNKHRILHEYSCFYALQETDNWTTSAMSVLGYIVCGSDHGKTAILWLWEVNHFRRSWVDHERCTAIMFGSLMLLSVNMPHSGRDEEDYIEASETVRASLTEGAVDFFIGGDLNIEFRLDTADDDLHGLDSIDWYGMYGPECRGGGEDTIAYEKNLQDFSCTVTSMWTNSEDNREFHAWRAWGSRARKKTARLHHGLEGHTIHDVVPESGEAPYPGITFL